MDQQLVYQLEKINDSLNKLDVAPNVPQFSETKDFSEGRNFKELGMMAVGGAISPIAGGIINKWIPVGNLAPLIAGFGIKVIVKNQTAQKIADGMIIASLAKFMEGLLQGKLGFGEGEREEASTSFSEMRVGGVNFG